MAAWIIDISGEMMLKKQKGMYVSVGTPNTVAWVMPQVFHGMSTDVTVALSSAVRESNRGS